MKNIGYLETQVLDTKYQCEFNLALFFPTDEKSQVHSFGPFTVEIYRTNNLQEINISSENKIAILSHGDGGNYWSYRSLIFSLVQKGYIVLAPEHYKNNRNDNSLSGTSENLIFRPHHLKLSLNFFEAVISTQLQKEFHIENVLAIGHSMGGYSVLALTGGEPWVSYKEKLFSSIKDTRVSHVVCMAPACGWFVQRTSLNTITAKLLVLVSEHDDLTPIWHGQLIYDYLHKKTQVNFEVIKNGNHFSFLSVFPESMQRKEFKPSQDEPNFNRAEFQQILFNKILQLTL